MSIPHMLTAIVPCNDLDASQAFYNRLGFARLDPKPRPRPPEPHPDLYRILSDGKGGYLHLTSATPGWLSSRSNPFGLYLYTDDVDQLAGEFAGKILEPQGPENKPWGMYEFSISDPDQTLIRIGWPTHLRPSK
jgi:catechol 2,3-dioxygenase-like lactoylglutathione lyase family enzyme